MTGFCIVHCITMLCLVNSYSPSICILKNVCSGKYICLDQLKTKHTKIIKIEIIRLPLKLVTNLFLVVTLTGKKLLFFIFFHLIFRFLRMVLNVGSMPH